jgi:endonuclease YncB( thermonuclease family)
MFFLAGLMASSVGRLRQRGAPAGSCGQEGTRQTVGTISRVVDGDTIHVTINGQDKTSA